MKITVEKFAKGGVKPPFAGDFEGKIAICLSKLMASTDDDLIAASQAVVEMACQWQAVFGYEPDSEAFRFEVIGNKVVYHSQSGTKYLLKNGLVIARAWSDEFYGPNSVFENTVRETVEIHDTMSIGDYLVRTE